MELSHLKDFSAFRSKNFWDGFFKKRKALPFEWYGEWDELKDPITAECEPNHQILHIGCGNSELTAHMYDAGFHSITNIDFSKLVIMEMLRKHVRLRPQMRWLTMDMTNTNFSDSNFDVVLDKGGLDALMGEESPESDESGLKLLGEVDRVLKKGGRYLCVTLAQKHVIEIAMERYRSGWKLILHKVPQSKKGEPSSLTPFLLVAEKQLEETAQIPLVTLSFDTSSPDAGDPEQIAELVEAVAAENKIRRTEAVKPENRTLTDFSKLYPGRRVQKDLGFDREVGSYRFHATILDSKDDSLLSMECGVFLVPQGREHEWMYSSEEGQWQILQSAQTLRLVLVVLNRGHKFGSSPEIQAELSPLVLPLAPLSCHGVKDSIPIMTTSEGVGQRVIVGEFESPLTGHIFVEDVDFPAQAGQSGPRKVRRLVFARYQSLVQSEFAMKAESVGSTGAGESSQKQKTKKKKSKAREEVSSSVLVWRVDHSQLASEYHLAMIAGMGLAQSMFDKWRAEAGQINVLIIGLGGGALPMFLQGHLPRINLHVVELDAVVVEVAKLHFGLAEEDNLKVIVGDGLEVVREFMEGSRKLPTGRNQNVEPSVDELASQLDSVSLESSPLFHFVIVDADSDDAEGIGMSCPPQSFLQVRFLESVKKILHEDGLLMVNVVARSLKQRLAAMSSLKSVYPTVLEIDVDEDLNKVLVASGKPMHVDKKSEGLVKEINERKDWNQSSLLESYKESIREVVEIE